MTVKSTFYPYPKTDVDIQKRGNRKPYVFVTLNGPNDGGDFGPNTPGTKTSGIQEALDYAHVNCRDVYIWGGRGGMHDGDAVMDNVYMLYETLYVPWSQDFKLDGGNYVLYYTKKTGDAVVIDSQMSCRYKFGLVACESEGAAVRFAPKTKGPDDFSCITASVFDFSALCSNGIGLFIDVSKGSISHTKIYCEETNTHKKGLYISDDGRHGGVISCVIEINFTNQCHATGNPIGIRVGDHGCRNIKHNTFISNLYAPRGVYFDKSAKKYITPKKFSPRKKAIGIEIFGQNNVFYLTFFGKRGSGKDIVFNAESRDNTVYVQNLPNGITNNAITPTNKIVSTYSIGLDTVLTPEVPLSGKEVTNRTCYSVEVVILTPGNVFEWTRIDAGNVSLTVPGGLFVGQTFYLDPGEKIKFKYTKAPTWKWKALR